MYKEDLALNNLQWLICHKTKPNQTCMYKLGEDEACFRENEDWRKGFLDQCSSASLTQSHVV